MGRSLLCLLLGCRLGLRLMGLCMLILLVGVMGGM